MRGAKVMRLAHGMVNELDLDDLRDKVHRALSLKAARGGHVAGISYGYRSEQRGQDRVLVIGPERAAIVREIYDRYGAGESCQRIAADLNARGVAGPGSATSVQICGSLPRGRGNGSEITLNVPV